MVVFGLGLTPGLVIRHRLRRIVTETDNIMFTTMTMNKLLCISTLTTQRRRLSSAGHW